MAIHVGTAPDSWGVWFASDERQTPWHRFLDEVALSEYDTIELGPYGYLPTDPARLAEELQKRALGVAGGTLVGDLDAPDGWAEMAQRTAGVCDLLEPLDAHYVVLLEAAAPTGPWELDDGAWRCFSDNLHRVGEYT